MHGHSHRITSRPVVAVAIVALAAAVVQPMAVAAKGPKPSGSPAATAMPSQTSDVGALAWATEATFEGARFHDLAVDADGRVLAVGSVDHSSDGSGAPTPAIWFSSDGARTWWEHDLPFRPNTELLSVVATDDGFLIAGLNNTTNVGELYATDGATIQELPAPEGELFAIERSPAGLHLLGMIDSSAFLYTSTDNGENWTQVMIVDGGIARDLAVTADGTLVAFGWEHLGEDRNAPTSWYSTDGGVDFTRAALPVDPGAFVADEIGSTPVGLLARVVDGEANAHEWLSHDGVSWQEVLQASGYPFPGAYGSEALLFGEQHLWHSFDGTTWDDAGPRLDAYDISASGVLPDGRVVVAGTQGGVADPGGAILTGGPAAP